jgi:hypothetical protein
MPAAQSRFGKDLDRQQVSGRIIDLAVEEGANDGASSDLRRLPDENAKAREYERFVANLKISAAVIKTAPPHGCGRRG